MKKKLEIKFALCYMRKSQNEILYLENNNRSIHYNVLCIKFTFHFFISNHSYEKFIRLKLVSFNFEIQYKLYK